ncbi:hypothetical protein LOOC260_109680 [Paucilactobacillus hokkaidonensis JCM 18461]|uniref:Uncharacterized protein n=2 Tax=Paucilactobacillus hokkaidonensis TaxID=1193095 RepID=A0A0A1GT80_9LACO|nr:hypothetical protein [Paucilactobacillus hokkaidonensis]KRO07673.1 hypothetical protein IV59_GL001764 [Paucilactobacillus hokkaidonensis]BAP85507.1 hypothetical protein LOOC260_109680 [Paucilactobacillus hokkaidonensis JCM 18461]
MLESGTIINKNEIDYVYNHFGTIPTNIYVIFKSGNKLVINFDEYVYLLNVLENGNVHENHELLEEKK